MKTFLGRVKCTDYAWSNKIPRQYGDNDREKEKGFRGEKGIQQKTFRG